jgi:hypothetical protein
MKSKIEEPREKFYNLLRKIYFSYRHRIDRLLEILPGVLSWVLVTMPAWAGFFFPTAVAYFILIFMVYWFYKSATFAVCAALAYLRICAHKEVDWLKEAQEQKGCDEIHHVVIIPNVNERLEKLRLTLAYLTGNDFPKKQISVVLAFEKREGKTAYEKARLLRAEFSHQFAHLWITYHPLRLNEVIGKASNESYAAKWVAKKLRKLGFDFKKVTISTCDADTLWHPKYFSCLTHLFLTDSKRYFHFYYAPFLLYGNFWELILPVRVQTTLSNFVRISLLMQPRRLIPMSAYTTSLYLLDKIGYWDTDIIPEDWHIFLQAFFYLGDEVKTIPIFLPTIGDATYSPTLWKTVSARYQQERRWAWGVTDVPYTIKQYFRHHEIPFWSKTKMLLTVLENHLLWSAFFFLLTLGATIPPLINPAFKKTVLGYTLPGMARVILTLSSVFLIVISIIDAKIRPPKPRAFRWIRTPILYLQWVLLPLVSFFFASLPGLDAHTRLMLNKKLAYKTSEK